MHKNKVQQKCTLTAARQLTVLIPSYII